MTSFPENNPAFDSEPTFNQPPWEHPYWARGFVELQEYGFSREFLVSMSEVDQIQEGRLKHRLAETMGIVRKYCEYRNEIAFEPQYISNALLRPFNNYFGCAPFYFGEAIHLLHHLIEADEIDEDYFTIALQQSYHPDNRDIMAFHAGVRADGTIIDALGPISEHPHFVDERGQLLDLTFMLPDSLG
jgi:hypothetical protein